MSENYIQHAKGIVGYYKSMIKGNSGHPEWQQAGLAAAERYLSLLETDTTSIEDMQQFLIYLEDKDNNYLYGGSAWEDIRSGVKHWINFKQK